MLTVPPNPSRSWIQGASSLDFVDDKTVCYMCGSHICFLDLETKKQRMFHCDVKGIGVLTANGHSGVFVFSEHKLNPSIFVYSFPKIELKNELKGKATPALSPKHMHLPLY